MRSRSVVFLCCTFLAVDHIPGLPVQVDLALPLHLLAGLVPHVVALEERLRLCLLWLGEELKLVWSWDASDPISQIIHLGT